MDKINNKTYFDYQQYDLLVRNVAATAKAGDADAEMDIQDIKRVMDSFCAYVNTVDMTEMRIHIAYARMEGNELRDAIQLYDTSRRNAHESAIASANAINRYARFYGAGKIFTGDVTDRYQVADFCLEVAVKLFQKGQERR